MQIVLDFNLFIGDFVEPLKDNSSSWCAEAFHSSGRTAESYKLAVSRVV